MNYDNDVLGVGNPSHPANQEDYSEAVITLDEAIDDIREHLSKDVAVIIEDHIYILERELSKTKARLSRFLPKTNFDVQDEIKRNKRRQDILEMIEFCEIRIQSHKDCIIKYGSRIWDEERLVINQEMRTRLINYYKAKLSC